MLQNYHEKSTRALQLAGMSEHTQQCYTRSVRQIVDFYNKNPDLISEAELEDYFLHRKNSIKYLAPYVFKVALSDKRIVKVENRDVFFKYKKSGSNRWRVMKLDAMEFIRRFLQHVLPTGFMKVRYYGFLNPSSYISMDHIRYLIEKAYGIKIIESELTTETGPAIICPHCGGVLKYCYSILPFQKIFLDTG